MLNKKIVGLAMATMLVLPVGAVSANTGTKATDQFEQLKEQFSKATSAPQDDQEQAVAPAVEGTPPTSGEEVNPEEDMKASESATASETPAPTEATKEKDAAVQTFTTDNPSPTKGTTPIASDTATTDPVAETAKENSNEMALAQTEQQITQYVQSEMSKEFKAQVDQLKEDQKQTMYLVLSGVGILSFVLGLFGGFLYNFSRRKEYY